MIRLLAFLVPGCLLVCCDKPGLDDPRGDAPGAAGKPDVRGHAPRHVHPGTPAELRKILRAAADLESPATREKAIADVAWNALETDPELAREAFRQLAADSTEKIRLIQHYALRLAAHHPGEALAWAETLESAAESSAAHSQIALTLAETDPARAAELLSASGVASREFDVAVVQVVQRWAAQSPPDAAAWVAQFPGGPAREAGLKLIAERWMQADAKAALAWLDTLADAGVRNEAALGLEEAILRQPVAIRDAWLLHAGERTRGALELQREQAIKEVGGHLAPGTTH